MKNTSLVPKVFIDTNVLLDYLIPARENHKAVLSLFALILNGKIEASFSTQSMLDAVYVGRKHPDFIKNYRETLVALINRTNASYIDTWDMKTALTDPDPDIEDSAQISFAYNQCCDFIITNDKQMLSREVPKPMRVMTPEEFVNNCRA